MRGAVSDRVGDRTPETGTEQGERCSSDNVGGGNRARTGDLLAASQTLSQLSYTPTEGYAGLRPATVEYTIAPRGRNTGHEPEPTLARCAAAPGALSPAARRRPVY